MPMRQGRLVWTMSMFSSDLHSSSLCYFIGKQDDEATFGEHVDVFDTIGSNIGDSWSGGSAVTPMSITMAMGAHARLCLGAVRIANHRYDDKIVKKSYRTAFRLQVISDDVVEERLCSCMQPGAPTTAQSSRSITAGDSYNIHTP